MTSNCVFCNITAKTEPCELIYEDDQILIFKDIKPSAKFHYLAIPKEHINNINSLTFEHKQLVEKLVTSGLRVLQENGADIDDVRIGFHVPPFNSVNHLHVHLITPASEMTFLARMIFKPGTWWFTTADFVVKNLTSTNKL